MGIVKKVLSLGLTNLGLVVEDLTTHVATRAGTVPLQWPAGAPGSIIYRLTRDPGERASIFSKVQTIVVNEGEVAVVLEDGRAHGTLEPGRYVFEKARIIGALDVIWIKTGQRALKWGVGNLLSRDGIQVKANGVLFAKVGDGEKFNAEAIQGALAMSDDDLRRFVMPRVQGVMRKTLAGWDALDLYTQRSVFDDAVRVDLGTEFATLGLTVASLEVSEIELPPEFKAVVAQGTMATHASRASLIDAQTRAQVAQIEAAANAQASLTAGMVDIDLMQRLQAQGIDPLKLKAIEALQTLAANPGQGGLLAGDAARSQLIGQVAFAALTQPAAAPPATPSVPVVTQTALPEATPEPETAASIQRRLDQLLDRFSEGKISEETYNKAVAALEARLTALKRA